MNKMIKTLKPLVQGGYHTDIRYLVRAMQIILDAGKFPKNLCDLVAAQEETTRPKRIFPDRQDNLEKQCRNPSRGR